MKYSTHALLISITLAMFTGVAAAQESRPSPTPEDTVRITTSLIQLDVVVTDKDGKPIADLKPEDFTVTQDGKVQKITNLSFVTSANGQTTTTTTRSKPNKNEIPPPPVTTSKGGRIITFVVDDGNCMATIGGLVIMRDGIRDFVDKRMLPDDRVAIYRTKGGTSLMQLYTSNKEILRKKLSKMNLLREGGCGSSFEPLRDDSTIKALGTGAATFENEQSKQARERTEQNNRRNQVTGTLGVVRFVIDRLRNAPQRKTLFLLSEGISVGRMDPDAADALREVADRASRASVVINTMSAKGLTVPGMIEAQDEVLPGIWGGSDNTGPAVEARLNEERDLAQGLGYLAYATGGTFIRNRNFLDGDIRKILDAEAGYYLLGYEPTEETFKGKDYHKIDVKVSRPELRISSRKGFYGRTDNESQPVGRSADSPLYQAISSPFDDNGMDIRLTTLVGHDTREGNFVRAIMHVPGLDITLGPEENGVRKTTMDVVAVALDEKGKIIEEFNRTYPIRVPTRGVDLVKNNGLDFSADIPFKKSGVYSFRVAIRDASSKRIGSAGEVVEIPDIKKGGLWVTGLSVSEKSPNGTFGMPAKRDVGAAFGFVFSGAVASVRKFARDSVLPYVFEVYNARVDKATSRPALTREVRIYKEGKLIATLSAVPIEQGDNIDGRIVSHGTIRLSQGVEPGEYQLQVIVRDTVADRVAQQSLDFEVLPSN